ncbi:MAG: serine/threonine protein kinase [Candidatus Riflebacteria bacterium]|nr:serine/threonine protein kinase [Candidatus Riflebacteria bacterium]
MSVPGYRILSQVGAGASGTVYRALQEDLGRVVALKVLRPGLFGADETRARFVREGRLQARLTHPNLVAVFDAGFADGQPYLVAEFVEGGTLRRLLEHQGALEPSHAAHLGCHLAQAVGWAHAAGVIHRDLKPENVLLTETGDVKVGDFGLARPTAGSGTLDTAAGTILGTPGYMAPEVLRGEVAGPAADVFALGVILYELFAGIRPFRGDDLSELLARVLECRPPLPSSLRSGLDAGLDGILTACLARVPAVRPTANDLAVSLAARGGELSASLAGRNCRATRALESGRPRSRMTGTRVAATTVRASPLPCGRSLRRTALFGAVAAGGLVGLLAVLLAWHGLPDRSGSAVLGEARLVGAGGSRPGGAQTSASLRFLDEAGVSYGTDRVRLDFEQPAPLPVRVRVQGSTGAKADPVEVPRGVRSWAIPVAVPSMRGETVTLTLEAGSQRRTASGGLLPSIARTGLAVLASATGIAEHVRVAADGARVVVVWRRGGKPAPLDLVMRASEDEGRTWGGVVRLLPGVDSRDGVPLSFFTRNGLLALCVSRNDRAPNELRATFWSGRDRVGPPRGLGLGADTLCHPGDGPSGPHLLLVAGRHPPGQLLHARLLAPPSLGLERPVTTIPLDVGGEIEWFGAVRAGPSVVAVALVERAGELPPSLHSAVLDSECGANRLAWRRLSEPGEVPGEPELVSGDGTAVLVTYEETSKTVWFRRSEDAASGFSAPERPIQMLAFRASAPCLTYGRGRFYLAVISEPEVIPVLMVLSSADGKAWWPLTQVSYPGFRPRSVRAAVASSRLVLVGKDFMGQIWVLGVPLSKDPPVRR